MSALIRPYQPSDRQALRKIFADTAFHGQSYEGFFDNADWIADIMTAGYTDQEPESCFVAESEGRVVGYLTGALNTHAYGRKWRLHVLPGVVKGFFVCGIWKSGRAWAFFYHGIKSTLLGEEHRPRHLIKNYPAHFHINVNKDFRGEGMGAQLAAAFFAHMKAYGVQGVHVRTASAEEHQRFFESLGFKQLLKKKLTLWNYLGQPPYYLITYGL